VLRISACASVASEERVFMSLLNHLKDPLPKENEMMTLRIHALLEK